VTTRMKRWASWKMVGPRYCIILDASRLL
jgi:hypothetical protein